MSSVQVGAHHQRGGARPVLLGVVSGPDPDLLEAESAVELQGGCIAFVHFEKKSLDASRGNPGEMFPQQDAANAVATKRGVDRDRQDLAFRRNGPAYREAKQSGSRTIERHIRDNIAAGRHLGDPVRAPGAGERGRMNAGALSSPSGFKAAGGGVKALSAERPAHRSDRGAGDEPVRLGLGVWSLHVIRASQSFGWVGQTAKPRHEGDVGRNSFADDFGLQTH